MKSDNFDSADAAQAAFYEVFETRNHAAMMSVWDEGVNIESIHPLGERIVGIESVSESWRQIRSGSNQAHFRLTSINRFGDDRLVTYVRYENSSIGGVRQVRVIATNIYCFNGNWWRMVLHHTSPTTETGSDASQSSGTPSRKLH